MRTQMHMHSHLQNQAHKSNLESTRVTSDMEATCHMHEPMRGRWCEAARRLLKIFSALGTASHTATYLLQRRNSKYLSPTQTSTIVVYPSLPSPP